MRPAKVIDANQEQLNIFEEQLFDLRNMQPAELAAEPDLAARLAEWREATVTLTEAAKDTCVNAIREQHGEVLTAIDELSKRYSDATKRE